jgi:hypothetical protein
VSGSARIWMSGLLLVAGVAGCRPESQITQYEVPKPETIQLPLPAGMQATPAAGERSTAGRPERMLGAIVPHGDQTWFFKLTGPVEPVSGHVEEFHSFVESLTFNDKGEPDWTLPADWNQQAGSGMRFSTITVSDKPPLEISVIALPTGAEPLPEQVLANVNRWRGQLSLPPLEASQMNGESMTVTTRSQDTATVVDYTGTSSGGGMMNAPFARMGTPDAGNEIMPRKAEAAGSSVPRLTYTTPEGWKEEQISGLRKAAFTVTDGEQKAEITVIDLAAGAGDRLSNINRWRGQIGLDNITADDLKSAIQSVDVSGAKGDYVVLEGGPAFDPRQSILGVIFEQGDSVWFVKLQGSSEIAKAQQANFEKFVKSLKIE